jgi:HK97 family phage major capsid protein
MSSIAELEKQVESLTKAVKDKILTPASKANGDAEGAIGGAAIPATARGERREDYGFKSPREFLGCVLKAYAEPHRPLDKRLSALSANSIRKAKEAEGVVTKAAGSDEQAGINDPYGGFLVPPSFSPNVLQIQPEKDPWAGRVTNTPMSTPIINMPARTDKDHTTSVSGGLTVTRRPETVAASASRMQFEQVSLKAVSLMGIAYATEEILVDSPQSFAAILAKGFSDQFIYHLAKERISGTGVGEFEGVLNSPALVTITAESGQSADTIVYNNIVKMRSRCWGYDQAIWLANHDTYPQLASLRLEIGLGGTAMYQMSLVEGRPDMLNGRPIFYTEYAKKLGDVGDLILGNWGEYLEGTYQPLQNDESVHVRFVNHERAFKFWMRNDGRCWWRSALTTVNSTATLSPFIVLAAR